jgi:hypothetical protein
LEKDLLTCGPVVSCSTSFSGDEEILRIVQVGVGSLFDVVDDTWFKIDKQGSRNIMLVVGLVEENIFSVFALSSVWLEDSIRSDSVFCAQLLPEFVSD